MQRAAFFSALSFILGPFTYASEAPAVPVVKDIILRNPSDEAPKTTFTEEDNKIIATVIVQTQAAADIHIIWQRNGVPHAQIPVHITKDAQAWRARSYVHAIPGQWEVRVMQGDTQVLAQKSFEVAEPPKTSDPASRPLAKPKSKRLKSVKDVLQALEPANKQHS